MPAPWKVVLIGAEVTVLAAFTGIGLHLALQPQRPALVPPPPLLLPSSGTLVPKVARPPVIPAASPQPAGSDGTALTPAWVNRLGRSDQKLLTTQWTIVQDLIGGIERYLRETVVPAVERRR